MTIQPIDPPRDNGGRFAAYRTGEAPDLSLVPAVPETVQPHALPENLGPLTDLDREMLDTIDEMVARRLVDGGTYNIRRADDVRFDVRQVLTSLPEDEFDRRFDEIESSAEQVSILESISDNPDENLDALNEMAWTVNEDASLYEDDQAYADAVRDRYDERLHRQVRQLVRADAAARD